MTTTTTKQSDIKQTWWHLDADGMVLGRISTQIAIKLMGKQKPYYVSHLDCGDYVVVTNVEKVEVTGKKANQKIYYRHSGFPGGFKQLTYEKQMEKDPKSILIRAVKGMLPKNKLQAKRMTRLKLFIGSEHAFSDKQVKSMNP